MFTDLDHNRPLRRELTDHEESAQVAVADPGHSGSSGGFGGGRRERAAAQASAEDVTLRVLVHQNPPIIAFMETFNEQFEEPIPTSPWTWRSSTPTS